MSNQNLNSGITEYYTPQYIVDAARQAFGGIIQLDPATSKRANNLIVKATNIFYAPAKIEKGTITSIYRGTNGEREEVTLPVIKFSDRGGLDFPWYGKVWMNHPFRIFERECKPNCTKKICRDRGYHLAEPLDGSQAWIDHAVDQHEKGNAEIICITFANTSEGWFKPLLKYPKCWHHGRVNYLDPLTLEPIRGVTKGSVIHGLVDNLSLFHQAFRGMGDIHANVDSLLGFGR